MSIERTSDRLNETNLRELHALLLHRPYRLRPAMQERLRHRRLVRALDAAVQAVVRRLERHLHERIRAESMARDKDLPVPLELERLAVVLADQIAQARLREPDPRAEFGHERPFELFGYGVEGRDGGLNGAGWGGR